MLPVWISVTVLLLEQWIGPSFSFRVRVSLHISHVVCSYILYYCTTFLSTSNSPELLNVCKLGVTCYLFLTAFCWCDAFLGWDKYFYILCLEKRFESQSDIVCYFISIPEQQNRIITVLCQTELAVRSGNIYIIYNIYIYLSNLSFSKKRMENETSELQPEFWTFFDCSDYKQCWNENCPTYW